MAAGVTAVSRKPEPALHRDHRPGFDTFARDMLQVEVPAPGTVSVALENGRDTPTVESAVTGVASPRSQANHAGYEIEQPAAVRTKTIRTATLRTNHCHPASQSRRIPKSTPPGKIDGVDCCQVCGLALRCRISGERILNVRLHIRPRARWYRCQAPYAGNLAQPLSRLCDHHSLSRIHLSVPKDRSAGLWHHHHCVRAPETLSGIEI